MKMALKERGLDSDQLNVTMELGSTQAIKQLVSAGLGITIISSLTVSKEFDKKRFKTLKIHGAPIFGRSVFSPMPEILKPMMIEFLINLLHDHDLLKDVLSKDYKIS